MVVIEMAYNGALSCAAVHGPSGTALVTDAPADNQGRGASFSPTDLVATALGTCILTTMAIVAERHGIELKGAKARVEKLMSSAPPRRIASLAVTLTLPITPSDADRARLEHAAHSCPVHQSLHPDVAQPISFVWG